MAIIYTYPRLSGQPEGSDLVLITDVSDDNKSKNTTIQSINDAGPQGTVTDVDLTMPGGFVVDKTVTSGDISFVVSGFPSELPADDPANSVQFNLNGTLTGVDGFAFAEDLPNQGNTLFLGGDIQNLRKRGSINLYDQGQLGLWANTSGNINQRVAITGPRGLQADTNQSSYQFALPGYRPNEPYGPNETPPSYTEPRVLVVEGAQYTTSSFDSSWFKVTDLPGLGPAGDGTQTKFGSQIQFAAADPPGSENFVFRSDPGLTVDLSATRTRLDVGHRLNPTARGEINIHSGARNQGYTQGGVLDIEYAYPTSNPVFGQTLTTAFVGLIGPEYDDNLVPGDPNATYALQGYNIQLPVVTPNDNTQTTYTDSRLLVVNGTTTGTGVEERFQSKWISPNDLGIGAGGVNHNVQFNSSGVLNGDSSFNYFVNNGGPGAPGGSPTAHELQIGAGGGALPGMLTLFGDDDPQETQGTSGILRFITSTGTDYATITGPDIQTELSIVDSGSNYAVSTTPVDTKITSGNGSGMQVYITRVDANGAITGISVAQQGSGYSAGDSLLIDGGGNDCEITVVSASQGPANEQQIYDIKLPKYAPLDDKIWFGKTTDPTVSLKEGELTTSDYFKVREETGTDSGLPTAGTTIQLQIGNPTSVGSQAEPYGSILLNGGDNTSEGGSIRFISGGIKTQWVNLIGPPGSGASALQAAPPPYSVMLPQWSPDVSETMFPDLPGGISGLESSPQGGFGANYQIENRLETTTSGSGIGCRVNIVSLSQSGGISVITVNTPGHGYAINDTITVVQGNNTSATIPITAIQDVGGGKVLVAAVENWQSQNANNNHQMKWIDFPSGGSDLVIEDEGTSIAATASTINFTGGGVSTAVDPNDANKVNVTIPPTLNQGFSPFPIYQGNDGIIVNSGSTLTIGCNTICDAASSQITVARVFGKLEVDCVIRVAVYSGELGDVANTELIAYGSQPVTGSVNGIKYRINLNDMLPNPNTPGTPPPVWSPAAGTPIVVVIEIDNSNATITTDSFLLGSTASSFPNSGIEGIFGGKLAFQMAGSSSVFDSSNTRAGSAVDKLIGYNTEAEDTLFRVCHHFDPFAP